MKRMNNLGFTLVEVLATVTILGILAVTAVVAYSTHIANSKKESYDMLAKSASDAAANYYMEHSTSTTSVTLSTLVSEGYLENAANPYNKEGKCTGKVTITRDGTGTINSNSYSVSLCCSNRFYTYTFPGGTKTKNSSCQAN